MHTSELVATSPVGDLRMMRRKVILTRMCMITTTMQLMWKMSWRLEIGTGEMRGYMTHVNIMVHAIDNGDDHQDEYWDFDKL